MTERAPRWETPGYGDILAARIVNGELEVDFANGDRERIPLMALGAEARSEALVRVEDGLSIHVGGGEEPTEITWMAIRSAADPAYAAHLRELASSEANRLGRRLRALREDRETALSTLAQAVGISVSKLTKIEEGTEDVRPQTLRALLQRLGASLADIAGSDALEVSVKALIARAEKAGVPRDVSLALTDAVRPSVAATLLARAFDWSREALLIGTPESPQLPVAVQFKAPSRQQSASSPLVHLALVVARLAQAAFAIPPYDAISDSPDDIRQEAIDSRGRITLASLLEWTWKQGIAVLPLFGKGGFSAAALEVGKAPTIVIKETRDLAVFWLFDLAHELGHIALGHVRRALIDVHSPTDPTMTDADENAATTFALELLLPNHAILIDEVRAQAKGDGVRFKGAVQRVSARARVSPGLLGIVAAFALPEVGRPKDRWGSATNLAKPEGLGRETLLAVARQKAKLDELPELDAALMRATVLRELI